MGFKIALFAVPISEKDRAISLLNLKETEQSDEYCESSFSGAPGKEGHYIVWKNADHGGIRKSELGALNALPSCLIMTLHEGIMSGDLTQFQNGQQIWKIIYQGDGSSPAFETIGDVPVEILKLYKELELKQGIEDAKEINDFHVDHLFEVLSLPFERATGLKYDAEISVPFVTLEPDEKHYLNAKVPWWKFWAKQDR